MQAIEDFKENARPDLVLPEQTFRELNHILQKEMSQIGTTLKKTNANYRDVRSCRLISDLYTIAKPQCYSSISIFQLVLPPDKTANSALINNLKEK